MIGSARLVGWSRSASDKGDIMMRQGTMSQPAPRGVARRLARLPIWLYRLGLGRLLGERFLMLTHIGRTSGRLRQTVVEVVRHDRLSDTYIIASGWGERADWYR